MLGLTNTTLRWKSIVERWDIKTRWSTIWIRILKRIKHSIVRWNKKRISSVWSVADKEWQVRKITWWIKIC